MYAKKYQVKRQPAAGARGRGSAALRDWLGEAKARQVYLVLRDRILSGAVGFGAKLPNENDLADVSRRIARHRAARARRACSASI